MVDVKYLFISHQTLNVKLTLKQDEAKNERRSLSTTFSINRRRGRMCELGAVLKKKITEMNSGFIACNKNKTAKTKAVAAATRIIQGSRLLV